MADENGGPGLVVPGYNEDPVTGAWVSLPWPGDPTLPMTDLSRIELLPPSLGPQIIAWMEYWLVHHQTGEPWRCSPGQKRYFHMCYSLHPNGTWRFDSSVRRGAKGTGKDPNAAVQGLAELCGPVRFAGWTDDGQPIGAPHRMAKVSIAANSIDQAKETLEVAGQMISPQLKAKLGIDVGMTRILIPRTGSKFEVMTASEKTGEGKPSTAAILNETHHMTKSNGGAKTAEVVRRNIDKAPEYIAARVYEFTNAHEQGGESVAEGSYEEWQSQLARKQDPTILYDSIEYNPNLNIAYEDDLLEGIKQAYSDAPWKSPESILKSALDTRKSRSEVIRYFLNGLGTAEEAWVSPAAFDARARPGIIVEEKERIAMFLDCSKSTDATTLSASRISDGHVISLGGWRKPKGAKGEDWLAPREVVDAVVREAFEFYEPVWFGVDPSPATDDETEALYWREYIDQWHRDFNKRLKVWATPGAGGHSVMFDMRMSQSGAVDRNRKFTEAAMKTALDIEKEQTLTHDGDPMLRSHVHNARRRPNQWGVSVGKINRSSPKLVDYAVTMIGARMGRDIVLNSGKVTAGRRRKARVLN